MTEQTLSKNIVQFNRKAVISGKVIELYEYEMPCSKGFENKVQGRANQTNTSEQTKAENRKKTAQRARATVRRTANANADILTKFVTLTFADNVTDITYAHKEFDKFIKRLKYRYPNIGYISVIEFQKRGAIHFHLLCSLPYIKNAELQDLWGHGFIRINKIDKVDNVGAYVTKYMTKDGMDERLKGRKSYTMSKNLKSPKVCTDTEQIDEILSSIEDVKREFSAEFESEYFGHIRYTQLVCAKPIDTTILEMLPNDIESSVYDELGEIPE